MLGFLLELSYNKYMFKEIKWLIDSSKMLAILFISVGIAQLFALFKFQEATLVIIFMLAVLIITQVTSHYIYGIISSFISVLLFNFFFTEPLYTFNTHQPDYIFTFFILLVASMISSTITSNLKIANLKAEKQSKQLKLISELNLNFLMNPLSDAIIKSEEILTHFFKIKVTINIDDVKLKVLQYPINTFYLKVTRDFIGTLVFQSDNPFSEDELNFTNTLVDSLSQFIERQLLTKKQVETEFEIREQKLKNNLLSAISHDLRTPLGTIIGSTETLIQEHDQLSFQDRNLLMKNILDDARWLIDSVQNILNFIQVDEQIDLHLAEESIEELFGDAISHVVSYAKQKIILNLPKDNILYSMDIRLMEKVILNLLNNAIKYSSDHSTIELRASIKHDLLIFEVIDEGNGIPDEIKASVFDRFVTAQDSDIVKRKGLGLGLSICKSIIEAHHGRISIRDNLPKGTIVRCTFPYEVSNGKNINH